jgi:hypothetical protein
LGFVPVVATGEELGAGLAVEAGVIAGAAGVVLAGEGAVAGDDVVAGELELELVAGSSAQPTAKAIARTAGSSNMVRLKSFVFELLICFPRSSKIEKHADDCSKTAWPQ